MNLSMVNLAVSSWTWHDSFYAGDMHLLQVPEKANQSNIQLVELNDFMLPAGRLSRVRQWVGFALGYRAYTKKQGRYRNSTIKNLIKELNQNNIQCLSWTIDSDLTVDDLDWRDELAYIITGFKTAQRLNATYLRITLGGAAAMGPEIDPIVVSRLKLIASLAQKLYPSISPVVENHWGISTDINRLIAIMKQVPKIGICFDPGNILKSDRAQAWEKLAEITSLFHLKVYDFNSEKLDSDLDYRTIFSLLSKFEYKGHVVIEYEGNGDPEKALKQIQTYLKDWTHQSPTNQNRSNPTTISSSNTDAAPAYNLLSSFGPSYTESQS